MLTYNVGQVLEVTDPRLGLTPNHKGATLAGVMFFCPGDLLVVTMAEPPTRVLKVVRAQSWPEGREFFISDDVERYTVTVADGTPMLTAPTVTTVLHDEYKEMVETLAKPGWKILEEMTAKQADLLHMAIGICGEAGELADAIKRNAIYQKPLDLANVIEELGDLEFYMEHLRNKLSITREMTLQANMEKLAQRYEGFKYSNEAAQARADKQEV